MKSKLTLLFSSFVLMLVMGSCTLEKRVYSVGYHVHWKTSTHAFIKTEKQENSQPYYNASARKAKLQPIEIKSIDEQLLSNHFPPSTFDPKALEGLSEVPHTMAESKTSRTQNSFLSSLTSNKLFPFKLRNSRYKSTHNYKKIKHDYEVLKHYKPSSMTLDSASIIIPIETSFQWKDENIEEIPVVQNIMTTPLSLSSIFNNANNLVSMTQKTNHSQAYQKTKRSKSKKLRNALLITWMGIVLLGMGLFLTELLIFIGVGFVIFGVFKLFKLRNTETPSSLVASSPELNTTETANREGWNKFLMGLIYVLLIAGTLIATVSIIAYVNQW